MTIVQLTKRCLYKNTMLIKLTQISYQDKLEAIQAEKKKRNKICRRKSIDTLTKALSRLSLQMNQEGKKIKPLANLHTIVAKRKRKNGHDAGLNCEKALAYDANNAELNAKNELLKEMNELKKAEADAKTSGGTSLMYCICSSSFYSRQLVLAVDKTEKANKSQ